MKRRICIDSSIISKWFKEGEPKEKEALELKDDILSGRIVAVINEYVILEIVRAMVKASYEAERIRKAVNVLRIMNLSGFMDIVRVSEVLDLSIELIQKLNLYASDALVLATAIRMKIDLITEDKHLLKNSCVEYAKQHGISITSL